MLNEWKQFKQEKSPTWFDHILLSNADKLFKVRLCHFLPSVTKLTKLLDFTLKIMFWFVCVTFSVLCGTNKILRAIVLLFWSNFFQFFECDGKSISFQLYWSIKCLIFDIFWGVFAMLWWFNARINAYWKQ